MKVDPKSHETLHFLGCLQKDFFWTNFDQSARLHQQVWCVWYRLYSSTRPQKKSPSEANLTVSGTNLYSLNSWHERHEALYFLGRLQWYFLTSYTNWWMLFVRWLNMSLQRRKCQESGFNQSPPTTNQAHPGTSLYLLTSNVKKVTRPCIFLEGLDSIFWWDFEFDRRPQDSSRRGPFHALIEFELAASRKLYSKLDSPRYQLVFLKIMVINYVKVTRPCIFLDGLNDIFKQTWTTNCQIREVEAFSVFTHWLNMSLQCSFCELRFFFGELDGHISKMKAAKRCPISCHKLWRSPGLTHIPEASSWFLNWFDIVFVVKIDHWTCSAPEKTISWTGN